MRTGMELRRCAGDPFIQASKSAQPFRHKPFATWLFRCLLALRALLGARQRSGKGTIVAIRLIGGMRNATEIHAFFSCKFQGILAILRILSSYLILKDDTEQEKRCMCGIVGYSGRRAAEPILLEGLSRLEYRGYDSAGVATMTGANLCVRKCVGRIAN